MKIFDKGDVLEEKTEIIYVRGFIEKSYHLLIQIPRNLLQFLNNRSHRDCRDDF